MQIVIAMHRRAQKLGQVRADHYLFFACENGNIDPTKPQKSWRTAWRQLTRAVHCPACRKLQAPTEICRNEQCRAEMKGIKSATARLRFHDLRHHAITELAESQASDAVIMGIAGHVSKKMLEHYSHARLVAKRTALDAISTGRAGYDTTDDATGQNSLKDVPEVIENMVELVGIEPTTSSLRTMASANLSH